MSAAAPLIAITAGDPAGIGPEIAIKAIERLAPRIAEGAMRLAVIGAESEIARTNRDVELGAHLVHSDTPAAIWPDVMVIPATAPNAPVAFGGVSAEAGRQAYEAVRKAVELAMDGRIAAIATAPLSKEAMNLAGFKFAGHTDLLAALTGVKRSCMMLAHGEMRVTHVSTHVGLARVPGLLTPESLTYTLDMTLAALRKLRIDRPRVAVAALNPHAGEGGLFGGEDDAVTVPVVAAFRDRGEQITGPVPGDTVFVKALARQFDAVVAMYHDQGHIPVKLLGFRIDPRSGRWTGLSGVNVTLGLPIVRTSVDHGTAFDIAGRNLANADSMVEAVEYALAMVRGRP